jgi:hypothetical protein
MLMGLCDGSGDFGRYGTLQYDIGNALLTQLSQTPLSKVIGRLLLKDRFPVFGKDGDSFTKKPVGYNDPRKRVTIPCFDVVACPAVPADVFKEHRVEEIRGIIQESIMAIGRAELDYFHSLLDAVAELGAVYPKISAKGQITPGVIFDAMAVIEHKGYIPTAIFLDYASTCMVDEGGTLGNVPVISFPYECPRPEPELTHTTDRGNAYIFGQPKNPQLANALLVHNNSKFRIKGNYERGKRLWEWEEPVELKLSENVGFLCGAACSLKITSGEEVPAIKPSKKPRIRAYVIGEEGDAVVSVL